MQISQDIDVHHYSIRGYDESGITINLPATEEFLRHKPETPFDSPRLQTEILTKSFIITATQLIRDWPPQNLGELSVEHIAQMVELNPELVLIGTGQRCQWPARELMLPLIEANIGYEVMDTAAACRTYNILSFEGRRVVAGLMPR